MSITVNLNAAKNISAERVVLRMAHQRDLALIQKYASDLRVASATRSIPHPLSKNDAQEFISRAMAINTNEDIWIIDGSISDLPSVLGVINLKRMDEARFNRDQSEVSYWVAPDFWNNGIASHALRGLLAANPQKSKTMFAEVFQDHPSSAHVLTNAGFQYLGAAENNCAARRAVLPTWTYTYRFES